MGSSSEGPGSGRAFGWVLVAIQFALIAGLILAPSGAQGSTVLRLCGGLLAAAGVGLAAWGALSLGGALTPHPAPRPGAPLVSHGPYSYVSHPIYLGLAVAGAGLALIKWSPTAAGLAVILGLFLWAKARYEARLLRRAHPGS